VIVMPAAASPLRGDARLFSYRQRFHFLRLLFAAEISAGRVILSLLEKKLLQPNYTYHMLEAFGKLCSFKPVLVIGADQAQNLARWYKADQLMQNFRFVVFARHGAVAPVVAGLNFDFVADFDEDISATGVREKFMALSASDRIARVRAMMAKP